VKDVSSLLEAVIGADNRLRVYISIARNWAYIAGDELVGCAKLNSVRCLPGGEYVVYVSVVGAHSVVAKSCEGAVLERIGNVLKHVKVSAIVFRHCSEIITDRKESSDAA
jgi:hypothetical protein